MLSHPRAQIRDTQHLAHKHGQSRTVRPALRNLVRDMLGATIQQGEHSSVCISSCSLCQIHLLNTGFQVTDARATMAIYRLHRKQWESGYAVVPIRVQRKVRAKAEPDDGDPPTGEVSRRTRSNGEPPTISHHSKTRARTMTQRKGSSSGISTVVRRRSATKRGVDGSKEKWWTVLRDTGKGPKGSIQVTM
jgi:RNA exonuclease 4